MSISKNSQQISMNLAQMLSWFRQKNMILENSEWCIIGINMQSALAIRPLKQLLESKSINIAHKFKLCVEVLQEPENMNLFADLTRKTPQHQNL